MSYTSVAGISECIILLLLLLWRRARTVTLLLAADADGPRRAQKKKTNDKPHTHTRTQPRRRRGAMLPTCAKVRPAVRTHTYSATECHGRRRRCAREERLVPMVAVAESPSPLLLLLVLVLLAPVSAPPPSAAAAAAADDDDDDDIDALSLLRARRVPSGPNRRQHPSPDERTQKAKTCRRLLSDGGRDRRCRGG